MMSGHSDGLPPGLHQDETPGYTALDQPALLASTATLQSKGAQDQQLVPHHLEQDLFCFG